MCNVYNLGLCSNVHRVAVVAEQQKFLQFYFIYLSIYLL